MARGWESKGVADQIEESDAGLREEQRELARSAEERQRQQQLASLNLSKSRLLQQLEQATNPRYREGLLKGLKAIEQEIDQLNVR